MSPDKLPVNLFDFALVAVLVVGVFRGRKHGMSEELLGLLKWLAILVVCALGYQPLGKMFARSTFSLGFGHLMAYVAAALVVVALFSGIKRRLGGKLLGSDLFRKAGYYLGIW